MLRAIEDLLDGEDRERQFILLSDLLREWPAFHREVRLLRQQVGDDLRTKDGKTFAEIGELIHVTESRARHIVKGIVSPSREKEKRARTEPPGDEGGA